MTLLMLLPSCISSNPLLMSGSGMVCVIIGSISILPSMYQSTIFGTSVRPPPPPKALPFPPRALPEACGAQLERGRCELRGGRRDPDDDGWAPAARAGFERLTHERDVAGAVEGIVGTADLVGAALRHIHEMRHQIGADLFRID